jgi:hypothetical protein
MTTPEKQITVEFLRYGAADEWGVRPAVYRVTASDHTEAPAGTEATLAELVRLVNPDYRPGRRLRLKMAPKRASGVLRALEAKSRQF